VVSSPLEDSKFGGHLWKKAFESRHLAKTRYLLLALFVVLLYGRTLSFDLLNYDDNLYVLDNPSVQDPASVGLEKHLLTPYLGYPIPITIATYILENALFGTDPKVLHATNVIFFVFLCLVFLKLAHDISQSPIKSFLFALIFASHPVMVETVSWVSCRKDLLASLFALISLFFFRKAKENPTIKDDILAILFVVLSILSKPTAILLPFLFLLFATKGKRLLYVCSALFSTSVLAITFFYETDMGALGASTPFHERLIFQVYHHIESIFFPFDLLPRYIDQTLSLKEVLVALPAICFAILLFVYVAFKRHPSLFYLLFSFVTYLPHSGLVPLSRQFADSYCVLPLAGLLLAFSSVQVKGLSRGYKFALSFFALLLALSQTLKSSQYIPIFKDGVALWTYVYKHYPDSPQVCRNLGNAFMFSRRFEPQNARQVYEHCIKTLDNRPFFLKNLAIATYHSKDLETAERLFHDLEALRPEETEVARRYLRMIEEAKSGQKNH